MSTRNAQAAIHGLRDRVDVALHRRRHAAQAKRDLQAVQRWVPDPDLDIKLNRGRLQGDPLADGLVDKLFASGTQSVREVNALFEKLVRHEDVAQADLRNELGREVADELQAYLDQIALPSWADDDKIRHANQVYSAHGIMAFAVLGCASLPLGYACPDAARVLGFTQQLTAHANRRLVETVQFVIDVMSRDGLQPGQRGVIAIQRVRLMHAAIRHLLLSTAQVEPIDGGRPGLGDALNKKAHLGGQWDTAAHGCPIHQVVLGATILCFSYVSLRAMRRLDAGLSADDECAYLHSWNAVGQMMGVHGDFLLPRPESYDAAEHLFDHVWRRFRAHHRNKDGAALMAGLLSFMEGLLTHLPRPVQHLPRVLVRDLVGRDVADVLGIELGYLEEVMLRGFLRGLTTLDHLESAAFRHLPNRMVGPEFLFRTMYGAMMGRERGSERPLFQIPIYLKEDWNVMQ